MYLDGHRHDVIERTVRKQPELLTTGLCRLALE